MSSYRVWLRRLLGQRPAQTDDSPAPPEPGPEIGREAGSVVFPEVPSGPEPTPFARAHNDFALALYRQLRRAGENLFYSPFSLRAALAMTFAGARGPTADEMRAALRFGESDQALHQAFGALIQRLNAAGRPYEMAVANSLWGQAGAPLQAAFLDLVARAYDGELQLLEFRHEAEAARQTINRWVEGQTRDRIRDLIPPGLLDPDTRLVLANAVYFKGWWEQPFEESATREEPFYLENGQDRPAPLMRREGNFRYRQADDFQVVALPYRGGDLALLVFLPDARDGLQALEAKLSAPLLHETVSQLRWSPVRLFLPRFKLEWGGAMAAPLAALGMSQAFVRFAADFSGINGYAPPHEESLFISAVAHRAFVELNEQGTEAAAATAVIMVAAAAMAPPPPVPLFRADHPFLFAIQEQASGAILFLGRLAEPASRAS